VAGLYQTVSYEGQMAIELEAAVDSAALSDGQEYPFAITMEDGLARLEPRPLWSALLRDLHDGVATGVIAARFHTGLARAIVRMIDHLAALHGDLWGGRIALSGGVFQNVVLSEALLEPLEAKGLHVLRHARVPTNDGGLSLGQAVVAAARTLDTRSSEAWKDLEPCA
jgi:hydrogenase maturation protein HypF